MAPAKPTGIEALTVRRAKISDNDKVRYRVYSSPTEFIAVIAESALMAVKVAGINAPYKIMRDLPTEGIAIEAKRMATIEDVPERVRLSTEHMKDVALKAEMRDPADIRVEPFVPVGVADLRNNGVPRPRILPPDLVNEIIEQHAKAVAVEAPAEVEVAPLSHTAAEPVQEVMDTAPEPTAEEQIIQAPLETSLEEKINALAEEVLPEAAPMVEETLGTAAPTLSPDEVEKLLNASQ